MKYPIDSELYKIAKVKMPVKPGLLPVMNQALKLFQCKSDDKVKVEKRKISGYQGTEVPVYVIEPKERKQEENNLPCLVFFHGGGFMLRASGAHYRLVKEYAAKLPCRVIYVDYRLAPEFPFPVPVEDCFAAYQWTLEHAEELKIQKDRIFLGGDSAGGNLAAAVTLMARDRGLTVPAGVMLIYPVTDRRMITESMQKFIDTPVWDAKRSELMWHCYLGDQTPEHIEYASPVEAASFEQFPPMYMEVAEFDCLRDEGLHLYKKIKETGASTELHEIKGGCHGYETAVESRMVRTCMEYRLAWLQKVING
ncbi:MAG: alpha/beta hydrolase [Lachnospiraceae bacterium]|nr:alpha/beta hydrolase [Lachnospiraceae bacterium]